MFEAFLFSDGFVLPVIICIYVCVYIYRCICTKIDTGIVFIQNLCYLDK